MPGDDLQRLSEADWQPRKILQKFKRAFPLQAADGDEFDRVTRPGNDRLFQSALSPDEDRLAGAIAAHPLLRDGDGWVNVATRATAGDHQPHTRLTHVCVLSPIVATDSAACQRRSDW